MRSGLSPADAQREILAAASPLDGEIRSTALAQGCVLSEVVRAERTLPPWDASAMDGYALRANDIGGASRDHPVTLPVSLTIAAGGTQERALPAKEAARIFTGAPLPPGADCVVRQEDTERSGDRVFIHVAAPRGEHVRPAGEDLKHGEEVLQPGTLLGPAELGLLASIGRSLVRVIQSPRVSLISSGDELVEADGSQGQGEIISSNSYSLAAQIREAGADPHYLGIAPDTPGALEAALRRSLFAHVIVSSAGVSVGDRDFVRPVLESLGCDLRFWGVKLKPGFPLVFGRFGETGPLMFGLPGNPVSAMVTFEQFVRPALLKMAGHQTLFRPRVRAIVAEALHKNLGRLHLVRVVLERDGERFVARPTGNQSSGVLRSMVAAHGLLIFPADAETLPSGSEAWVQVLDSRVLKSPDSGL